MTLTADQRRAALLGPCFALRFLVRPEARTVPRGQMAGLSDAAIFHRWMDLFWTLGEPEAVALLTKEETRYLEEFNRAYESLPWRSLESHPHISEVDDEDLARLLPPAARLLESLERRTRPNVLRRCWQRVLRALRLT